MKLMIRAACLSDPGRVRRKNEDNFYFGGYCMPETNTGLRKPAYICRETGEGMWLAVFDGMGGESLGEAAAFAAASEMRRQCETLPRPFMSETHYISNVCMALNAAVVNAARRRTVMHTGTTLAALYITHRRVCVCNVGDSRVYRLRRKELSQLSQDHVDGRPYPPGVKPPLMQHLGIDPKELLIRPYITKGRIAEGDCYLLCSDGLTDMLTELQIADMMIRIPDVTACAEALVKAALNHGGRDNVTVIVCRIGGGGDLPHSSGHEIQHVVK